MKLESGSHEVSEPEWGVIAAELAKRVAGAKTQHLADMFDSESKRILARHPAAKPYYEAALAA